MSVHRKDCPNVSQHIADKDRLIEVEWYKAENAAYKADISIMAHDRAALLLDITNTICEARIPLKAVNARTTRDQISIMNLTLEITDAEQLNKIIKKLKRVEGVFDVARNKQY